MYEILEKRDLSADVKLFSVLAPKIAKKAQPGQFVMVRAHERGERIPLTIADFDREKGTVTIIFQELGKSTRELGALGKGDGVENFSGPLGCASEIEKYGTVVCIGGGVGIAPLYPIARALKNAGNEVISIIGARNRGALILENEMLLASSRLHVTTDDGSAGRKGFVSDVLKELIASGKKIDAVWAIGPVIMMKVVAEVTRPYRIKTTVSLNPIMVDGTGMCGGCRVTVGGQNKFACVDGPEFDGHAVDFDNLMIRNKRFTKQEKLAAEKHRCKLEQE